MKCSSTLSREAIPIGRYGTYMGYARNTDRSVGVVVESPVRVIWVYAVLAVKH